MFNVSIRGAVSMTNPAIEDPCRVNSGPLIQLTTCNSILHVQLASTPGWRYFDASYNDHKSVWLLVSTSCDEPRSQDLSSVFLIFAPKTGYMT